MLSIVSAPRALLQPARLALFLLLLLAGCHTGPDLPRQAQAFGDAYQVVTNVTPASPDVPPVLLDDSLSVNVRYAGGCTDHTFTLQQRVRADTATVWLVHDASGDGGEALIFDVLRLDVPDEIRRSPVVVLLNPGGGPPFLLRRGRPDGH